MQTLIKHRISRTFQPSLIGTGLEIFISSQNKSVSGFSTEHSVTKGLMTKGNGGGIGVLSQMAVLPKLVVFDLDDTLWSPEMWLCAGAPFSHRSGKVFDSSGVEIKLIGDSRAILHELATEVPT